MSDKVKICIDNNVEVHASEIDKQRAFMQYVRKLTQERNKPLFAYVDTYGCQQNEADSEKLRGMLVEMGYEITTDENAADIAVVNTCAIRANAENRVLGNVGALVHTKRANPKQLIVFCGCLAGVPETVVKVRSSYHHVGLVFPPNNLWRFPELVHRAMTEKKRVFATACEETVLAEGLPTHRDGKVKAWLSIMYGCNNFCSYCIVPYVRGRERSRRLEVILDEARDLVALGYKDITLLGQNVNSYGNSSQLKSEPLHRLQLGSDFECSGQGENSFAELIRQINDIDGEFVIRFMTSHPKDASTELFYAMAECEKVAKHIHLPFQAGSDRILKLMNRGYTQKEYLEKIAFARNLMPELVITSDVIVGYPGETEEEFNDTLSLVEKAQFEAMFTFIYSRRPGTPAAKLQDNVTREEKQVRFERLMDLQNEISERKHEAYVGKVVRVLVDGEAKNEEYPLKARTNGGRLVHLKEAEQQSVGGESALVGKGESEMFGKGEPALFNNRKSALFGKYVDAKITHSNNWSLFGEA